MRIRGKPGIKKLDIKDVDTIAISIMILTSLLIISTIIYVIMTKNKIVYASTDLIQEQEVHMQEHEKVDIYQYIVSNVEAIETEEIIVESIDLEYTTSYIEDPTLANGVLQVVQEGRDGTQEITTKKRYMDGVLKSEEVVKTKITKATINKIVKIGTAAYSSNYKAKIGDELYVTSDRLTMRKETNEDSEKITVLRQNAKVEILEIQDNWYRVQANGISGWVQSFALTNIDPMEAYGGVLSKAELLDRLSFDMILNQKSGLSLNQFKAILSDPKDKNGIFASNAEYFYYIEKEYGINGVFVAAVAIHESAWGTSKISLNKNNLFGYGASDSDPYNNAYDFSSYAEGIDLVARVLVKYYINAPGTKIYDGNASGKYYTSSTLSGVGKKYASDSNWSSAVYKWMEYLYNKI